jgi:hypothetical protein
VRAAGRLAVAVETSVLRASAASLFHLPSKRLPGSVDANSGVLGRNAGLLGEIVQFAFLQIYVRTVVYGDMTYTAENPQNLLFGYNPTDLVVHDPVNVCVDNNKLVFIRPNRKEYKAKIVRIERKPASRVDN